MDLKEIKRILGRGKDESWGMYLARIVAGSFTATIMLLAGRRK